MKKKLVIVLLTVAMGVSLIACGGAAETTNDTKQENVAETSSVTKQESVAVESTKESGYETGTTISEDAFWKTREMVQPSLEDVSVRSVSIEDVLTIKIATTPFNFDIDEIEQKLRVNSFITDRFNLSREKRETIYSAESYTEGDFHDYVYTDAINGRLEGEDTTQDFYVSLTTDYSTYDNVNYASVYINNMPEAADTQENIRMVLKDIFGEEVAEYLVYGPSDPDANARDKYNMEAVIESSGGNKYLLERDLEKNDHNVLTSIEGTWKMTFSVRVSEPGFSNLTTFAYYDGKKVPMAHSAKYNMSDITEGGVSDINLNNFSQMFPEYTRVDIGSKFIRNDLTMFSYNEEILSDGAIEYCLDITGLVNQLADVPGYQQPKLDVSYTLREKDDALYYVDVSFKGSNIYRHVEEIDNEKLLNSMKEQVSVLMPNIDLSETVYSEGVTSYNIENTFTYMGVTCEYKISFNLNHNNGDWSISIDSK